MLLISNTAWRLGVVCVYFFLYSKMKRRLGDGVANRFWWILLYMSLCHTYARTLQCHAVQSNTTMRRNVFLLLNTYDGLSLKPSLTKSSIEETRSWNWTTDRVCHHPGFAWKSHVPTGVLGGRRGRVSRRRGRVSRPPEIVAENDFCSPFLRSCGALASAGY